MAQISGPTLALGINSPGAKQGAAQFKDAMGEVTTSSERAERPYRDAGQQEHQKRS